MAATEMTLFYISTSHTRHASTTKTFVSTHTFTSTLSHPSNLRKQSAVIPQSGFDLGKVEQSPLCLVSESSSDVELVPEEEKSRTLFLFYLYLISQTHGQSSDNH